MKRHLFALALAACAPFVSSAARADDGGTDAGVDAEADAEPEGIRETTTDNFGCALASTPNASSGGWLVFGAALSALAIARRRKRVVAALILGSAVVLAPIAAHAEEAPRDPDVRAVQVDPPPLRRFSIALAPIGPTIGRWGGSVELLLASHHALGLSGAYVHSHTNEDTNNVFRGGIGEVGYRYYFGENGARGFFLGPSFILGRFDAVPERGATTSFWNLGGALDLGFSALVADRVLFALGAGIQYTAPTESFPAQELPASIYARAGVRPRLLLALGFAF
ncbi:hypothetical protein BH09MYX1_BH09MYX1_55160 [soil metagenome]